MTVISVSKEAFNLLSTAKMATVGMDTKIYRHSQSLNGGFFQVKVIKFVLEQEHNCSLYLSYLYSYCD